MLNEAGTRYQDQVPAVARAVRVLETLAAASESCSLANLARQLDIRPSSLLAILTTLRHAGLVSRTPSGQYQAGSGLVALGSAAACRLRACERFTPVAERLVSVLGETALLWAHQDETYVLVAAREGTQPLRFVPTPGLRVNASAPCLVGPSVTVGIAEGELLPGVWMVAAPLPTGPSEQALVGLAGPRERLATPAVRAALVAALDEAGDAATSFGSQTTSAAPSSRTILESAAVTTTFGPIEGTELDGFLSQSLVATLSYLADDGYPATVPLWYAWDGSAFWLASRPGSEWVEHVLVDPRVSLAVSESTPPLRRVLARGLLVEIDDPGGQRQAEIEQQLAARYAGFDAAREPAAAGRGRLLQLRPERLIAWRGLLRHPKLPPGPEGPGSTAWRNLG